ncbi:hypothetical protein [Bacteroides sp. 519]|uniref:hypothetical protein n=1 Tax=Bacteroides sp. 519 TaxID=2302937 RepID=UPI0013D4A671|nr:hypothetical protein [Bacteroides sp. 519]NDV58499.1 hypothetical protein [Bacteroides sp. 519]
MVENQEKESILVDSYKCGNCGAYAKYKPGTTSLHCDYCGSETLLEAEVVSDIEELDFESYRFEEECFDHESTKVVHCHHCDAQSTFEEKQKSMVCPYCGTAILEADVHYERLIKPAYIQPFGVAETDVQLQMGKWIKKLWFAPNKLAKQAAYTNQLKGVFIPYWTYDANTYTDYKGQRGDTYTVTVGSGKNRRTETRTRWRYVSGRVSRFFDDVMVPASRLIPENILGKLENWNKNAYIKFDNRYLAGMLTEKYSLTFTDGFEQAKTKMDAVIQGDIRRDIGGDHQRISSSHTEFQDIKFKLVLLPLFMSSYSFNNKLYHFYVNGCTGKIHGDRPYSKWKIFFAVLLGIIAIAGLVYLFMTME